jgi:TusA-related sulfurtransferase
MATLQITRQVDARGLACPMPIVKTAQAMRTLAPGEVLEVLATDQGSVKDFAAWSKATGHRLHESSAADGVYRFVLIRK